MSIPQSPLVLSEPAQKLLRAFKYGQCVEARKVEARPYMEALGILVSEDYVAKATTTFEWLKRDDTRVEVPIRLSAVVFSGTLSSKGELACE